MKSFLFVFNHSACHILSSFSYLYILLNWITFQALQYILAVFLKRVLEAFRHEDIAPKDTAQRRPLDLVG